RPQLSAQFNELLRQAWLCASLAGEEQIRSIHLLMAFRSHPSLLHCDGLWPLLSLTAGQITHLRPLLDVQSDERPEEQAKESVLMAGDGGDTDNGNVAFVGRPVGADTPAIKEGKPAAALLAVLDRFTTDVTAKARDGKIDPVFGRDNEIRQMVDILS
ncbi:type VI secretion system ATPase TssH, partial [Enterobacter sp. PTB]